MTDLRLARLCELAYRNDFTVTHTNYVQVAANGVLYGYWSPVERTIIFLGSNDYLDWLMNFQRRIYRGVHKGFNRGWNAIKPIVMELINSVDYTEDNEPRITVAGHSLGGALATLALCDLPAHFKRCVTFGSPRVFAREYARRAVKMAAFDRIVRYVFFDDPVTWVPIVSSWIQPCQQYAHFGRAVYLPWLPSGITLFGRHRMRRYITELEKLNSKQGGGRIAPVYEAPSRQPTISGANPPSRLTNMNSRFNTF